VFGGVEGEGAGPDQGGEAPAQPDGSVPVVLGLRAHDRTGRLGDPAHPGDDGTDGVVGVADGTEGGDRCDQVVGREPGVEGIGHGRRKGR